MKKVIYGIISIFIILLSFQSCEKETEFIDLNENVKLRSERNTERLNCNIDLLSNDIIMKNQLIMSKLFVKAIKKSPKLRLLIKEKSLEKGCTNGYKEIIIKYLLTEKLANDSIVNDLVKKTYLEVFNSDSLITSSGTTNSISQSLDYNVFISSVFDEDPLMVIKIPDWLKTDEWDVNTYSPPVFSNRLNDDGKMIGFKDDLSCYEKNEFYKSDFFEIMIKTSEDHLLINENDVYEFINLFFHPCISTNEFIQNETNKFDENGDRILLKKCKMRDLFDCGDTTSIINSPDPSEAEPPEFCFRDIVEEENVMYGFKLSDIGVMTTINNQPCIGGEESFDFQVDFLTSIRTGEAESIPIQLPKLPYYGVRASDLMEVTVQEQNMFNCPAGTYLKVHMLKHPFEWYRHLNTSFVPTGDWDKSVFGSNIYTIWNETDYTTCIVSSSNSTSTTDVSSQSYSLNFLFPEVVSGVGGNIGTSQNWSTTHTSTHSYTVSVSGSSQPINLGYNALHYCDNDWTFGTFDFCSQYAGEMHHFYPTGPQAIEVSYGIPYGWFD